VGICKRRCSDWGASRAPLKETPGATDAPDGGRFAVHGRSIVLSRAFKRIVGAAPAAWRRERIRTS
jgi:hypothetical protein